MIIPQWLSQAGVAAIVFVVSQFVAAQCFGAVFGTEKGYVYLPAWRRWLVGRGLKWGQASLRFTAEGHAGAAAFFRAWGALATRGSRFLAAERMQAGLRWYTSNCMIMGVE